mgnify:CR=1 FL=1
MTRATNTANPIPTICTDLELTRPTSSPVSGLGFSQDPVASSRASSLTRSVNLDAGRPSSFCGV